ncbi:hypothetical protein [Leadbetterella sp. DM7]|uniref:hypothetical protein n=1 Tax=Leadbetterella sp. DM7 TaxID=3235085 RepID=UPI00349F0386
MKLHHPRALFLFLSLLAFACNKQSKDTDNNGADEIKVMIPAQTCYMGTIGRDSIFLKTERFPNVVTGTLEYKNYEKDRSTGTIDGIMNGDTLVADYTFTSEGTESVAQVVFLLQGDTAMEGYGEKEEKDGKMVFKDLRRISFDNPVKLNKVECHH